MSEWAFVCLLIGFVAIYEFLLSFQGFCMIDEGALMNCYQWAYHSPQDVAYYFLYYNALAVGGIWEMLFGHLGYWGFRLFNIIVICGIVLTSYVVLHHCISRLSLLGGILLILLTFDYGLVVFDHDTLTALIAGIVIFCLSRGLRQSNVKMMFLAGLFLAINIFSRIPNIAMFGLLFVLVCYYMQKKSIKYSAKLLAFVTFGAVVGVLVEVAYMAAVGHLNIFITNLDSGLSASGAVDSTHNVNALVHAYIHDYIAVCLAPIRQLWLSGDSIYYVYAFCTVFLAYAIWHFRKDMEQEYLPVMLLLLLYFMPLGSDFGIGNMGTYAIWIALPYSVGFCYSRLQQLHGRKRCICLVLMTSYLSIYGARQVYRVYNTCYFDLGPRNEKTYRINAPLANTLTTKKAADAIDSLLEAAKPYINDGDKVLCFQCMPTIHYLTHTRPYLANPWPWTYDSSAMAKHFHEAEISSQHLPVIILQKSDPMHFLEPYTQWNNAAAKETFVHKNKKIEMIQDFICQHHYQLRWQSSLFQILTPQQ